MITEAELRRRAAAAGVDTMVQDIDYGLGWFLAGLFTQTAATHYLVFKGGTCLRKCYFADYRFSEDLDFTLRRAWPLEALAAAIEQVRVWSLDADGPDFGAAPVRLEVINDEYGLESYQARVYYRGPLRWGGSPRAIQLDVSRGEALLFPVAPRPLHHPYSDAGQFPPVILRFGTILSGNESVGADITYRPLRAKMGTADCHTVAWMGTTICNNSPASQQCKDVPAMFPYYRSRTMNRYGRYVACVDYRENPDALLARLNQVTQDGFKRPTSHGQRRRSSFRPAVAAGAPDPAATAGIWQSQPSKWPKRRSSPV